MRIRVLILAGLFLHVTGLSAKDARPNMLVIMVDDLGYGDLSSYGAKDMCTPHIDGLISEGMRFNEFYSNCCVCTPTRAALLSGRYPAMVGLPGVVRTDPSNNFGFMTPNSIMLPELFQKAGYHTSLIGKWHLGLAKANRPNQRGFDLFHGFLGDMMDDCWTHLRFGNNYMRHNEKMIDPKGHATDLFTQWSIDSLKMQAKSGAPFFQFLAYNAPHRPIQPPEEWLKKVQKREKGIKLKRAMNVAFIEHLDEGIGKVLKALDDLKLSDNTIVVFTSDNGGKLQNAASNGPLRSGKAHVYEGGIKVTTGIRWPAKIKPGQVTDFHALTMDILPTFADLAGIQIDHAIDGRSFKELLLKGDQPAFEGPVYHMWEQGWHTEAIRQGHWKLLRDRTGKPYELYDIKKDPYETTNLAKQQPERVDNMSKLLEAHMTRAQQVPWKRPEGAVE